MLLLLRSVDQSYYLHYSPRLLVVEDFTSFAELFSCLGESDDNPWKLLRGKQARPVTKSNS